MLPFTERVQGMVAFEAFNLLNRQSTTMVNNVAYVATAGVLRPVQGVGDPTAADGYPYGSSARRCQLVFRVTF
jgi:hypothetical protein